MENNTDLQTVAKKFNYQGIKIRTTMIEGAPWFVAKDVCIVLGLSTSSISKMVQSLTPSMHCKEKTLTTQGSVFMVHLSEAGLNMLLMRSNRPEAKRFQEWIASEVLPSSTKSPTTLPSREEGFLQVHLTNDNEQAVSGRMLHEFLAITTPYHKWFPRMCEYGFMEKQDYTVTDKNVPNSAGGKQTVVDHVLKINMAKELAMLARSERGKQARQYFIQIEKDWNSPEKIMARALLMAKKEVGTLKELTVEQKHTIIEQQETITLLTPKAKHYDIVMSTASTYTVSDVAFFNNVQSQKLFRLLRQVGWLTKKGCSANHVSRNAPEGVFKIIKTIFGEQIRVTIKGRDAIEELMKSEAI